MNASKYVTVYLPTVPAHCNRGGSGEDCSHCKLTYCNYTDDFRDQFISLWLYICLQFQHTAVEEAVVKTVLIVSSLIVITPMISGISLFPCHCIFAYSSSTLQ